MFVQKLLNGGADNGFSLGILVPVLDQYLGVLLQQSVQQGLSGQLDLLLLFPGHLVLFQQIVELQLVFGQTFPNMPLVFVF